MERLNEHELLKDTCNKTIDIKISTHDAFLEKSSSGTLRIERLENKIT